MKVLVTGGAGFIGSHLVNGLLGKGHSVVVIDNLSTGLRENLPSVVSLFEADIRDPARLVAVLSEQRPEVVFHLAAQMNVRRSLADPSGDAEVNILGGLRLFRASEDLGVRRIIFASSGGAVYGEHRGRASLETDMPLPSSPYGIAKVAVEHYGRHFAETSGRDFVALRLANVYGPLQNPGGEAGIVSLFLQEMSKGRAPTIFGDGTQTRDFVWVGDVVEAFLEALEGPSGIYNIGTGEEVSVNDIYERLKQITGFRGEPKRVPGIRGEVLRNAVSYQLAREHLHWSPRMALRRGLEATVQFAMDSGRLRVVS